MNRKAKDLRKRLSLQNQNLGLNKLNQMLSNMGMEQREEEKEVTEEEDPLKYFSQQQKKKKKEEEAKRYLKPILEEEDPLKYFDKNAEKLAEDEDPEKFLKQKEERPSDDLPKLMGKMLSLEYNEQDLANKILENDIPQEIELEKKKVELKYSYDERRKKMEKRAKTSLRLSQRQGFQAVAKDKLMERLQNYKNNNVAKTKDIKPTENKNSGNTLLSAKEIRNKYKERRSKRKKKTKKERRERKSRERS